MRIGDLIHLPPVQTVVRLADLGDQVLRRHLVETFVFTKEVSFALFVIFNKISATRGDGVFIVGNYGSGKSHLLNILSLTLSDAAARETFAKACREAGDAEAGLASLLERAAAVAPLVVEISLVEHNNREYLEHIVLACVEEKLRLNGGSALPEGWRRAARPEIFSAMRQNISAGGWGGLVLLIDELSEFLRSKENSRLYNEDVRFLQYLGEFAENIPAWVVATMQENIETTGSLSGEMLQKIKDRYPVRFQLSGKHVKEIVSKRLVQKKNGTGEELSAIYQDLQRSFERLPFSRQDFDDLYPVHPVTVELLDELRPLFSQHRGVIDFIHYRLAGDPGRGIPTFLDQPAASLLTPDYIFDHFRDRLRETVETSPYSEQIFHHYEREAEKLFSEEEDAHTALSLLKLLILGALARAPRSFTVEELAGLLLHRYSSLESGINYDYIADIMDKLIAHGAYVTVTAESPGAKKYSVDLKADVALLLQKKLSRLTSTFDPGDSRVLEALFSWADEPYLPLNELKIAPLQEKEITWQNTRRKGKVLFADPAEIKEVQWQDFQEELSEQESDFIFIVAVPNLPGGGEQNITTEDKRDLINLGLPDALALWSPRELAPAEEERLRRAYAHLLLQEEYAADNSLVGLQVNRQLKSLLAEEKRAVKEIFRNSYFQGKIAVSRQIISPASLGYQSMEATIARAASEVLKERFPRHYEIRPQGEQITGTLMQRTLDLLVSPRLEDEELERGGKLVIENYLKPLGLVKKKGQGYLLEINPKTSPLIADFLALIPETGRINLNRLYRKLRKGPFGLSADGFCALGTAAILSGAVSAYQGGKRLSPSQVSYYRFWNIEEVGPGTLIRPELQSVLAGVPFIPPRLRNAPLTFASQQQIWELAVSSKGEWAGKGAEIRSRMERLKGHQIFAAVDWGKLEKSLDRLAEFLDEIKVSYSSQEGLERLLAAYQSRPLIFADLLRLEALYAFLQGDLPEILRLGHYLKEINPAIPEIEKYSFLSKRFKLLSELLEEEALLWEEQYRERLKREFDHFLDEYTACYLEEHRRAVGPEKLKPYRALMETKAYRLLEQLGRINTLIVKDDLVTINRQLARLLDKECCVADELILRERPQCPCGFVLGQSISLPELPGLEIQILRGLKAYTEALSAPASLEKISAYAGHLVLVGRRREAESFSGLLKILADGANEDLVSRLAELINQHLIASINRALTGESIISERSMEELADLLSDRVFTLEQLQELFQTWLSGGEEKPPGYIRVTGRRQPTGRFASKDAPADQELLETREELRFYLEEKFPRLAALANRNGEAGVYMAALVAGWLKFHNMLPGAFEREQISELELLVKENLDLDPEEWRQHGDDLTAMGETILAEREALPRHFLERAVLETTTRLPAEQLLENYNRFRSTTGSPLRFDSLLDLLVDEPYFPALSRLLAGKLALQVTSEELSSNLTVMAGTLKEACRSLNKNGFTLTESHREEKRTLLAVLHDLARCNLLLHDLERVTLSPPEDDKGWEKLYRQLAPFELILSTLDEAQARVLLPEATLKRWQRRYVSLLEPLAERFAGYCLKAPQPRRLTLSSLFRQFPGWVSKDAPGKAAYLVILDGVRLDIWGAMLERMLSEHSLEIIRDGLTWAAQPTITAAQLQPLKEEGLLGHILNMDESLISELISDPPAFLQVVNNARLYPQQIVLLKAMKFDFVDEKIHRSREPLASLLQEVLLQSRVKMRPLLDSLTPGALILVVSDHGFKTNLNCNKANKEELLYLHGGSSFFETLAPWALLRKRLSQPARLAVPGQLLT